MKILMVEWNGMGQKKIKKAFTSEGHNLVYFPLDIDKDNYYHNPEFARAFIEALRQQTPDIVFSVDFFPVISRECQKEKIRYVSWVYDSPHIMLYYEPVLNSCNHIYIFDRTLYLQLCSAGVSTVHYMPLAADADSPDDLEKRGELPFLYDISFVGSLYLEGEDYYGAMEPRLPDYANGYLDGLINSQMKIHGYNFIEESLGPVINDLDKALHISIPAESMQTRENFYAQCIINRRITAIERMDILDAIAQRHKIDLFTHYKGFTLPNLENHGKVDYDTEMPRVMKQSKINLNITLRSIQSGIPLRAFDIMGEGGFLLSNFQAEFLDYFVPGKDFVYYESKEDLLQKIDYYLAHEDERMEIAKNGHEKIAAGHTYRHRVREMLERV